MMSVETVAPIAPTKVIAPPRGWQLVNVAELWRFRELVFFLIWRDVKVRYKQTVLGAAWAVLQPLLMMAVFTIFFARMAKVSSGNLPYPLFAYTGLLPWTFFASAITNAGNSVVGSERLITKIYFPRLAIPFGAVGASVVDFLVAFGLLTILGIGYCISGAHIEIGANLIVTPLILVILAIGATGIGTLLAALNVAYRDFRYVLPFLVQVWMFATPTVYMEPNELVGWQRALLMVNPITPLVAAFRVSIFGGNIAWNELAVASLSCIALFTMGCLYFRKVESAFADII